MKRTAQIAPLHYAPVFMHLLFLAPLCAPRATAFSRAVAALVVAAWRNGMWKVCRRNGHRTEKAERRNDEEYRALLDSNSERTLPAAGRELGRKEEQRFYASRRATSPSGTNANMELAEGGGSVGRSAPSACRHRARCLPLPLWPSAPSLASALPREAVK